MSRHCQVFDKYVTDASRQWPAAFLHGEFPDRPFAAWNFVCTTTRPHTHPCLVVRQRRGLIRRASRVTRRDEPCSVKLSAMTRRPLLDVLTPALLASCFLLLTATRAARAGCPRLPPVTLGAGMRTSFVHDRLRRPATPPMVSRSTACVCTSAARRQEDQVHVQHRVQRRQPITSTCIDAVGAVRVLAASSTSGSAASCRRATARTCTARTTRITGRSHRRRPGRLSVRLPGPRQRRRCTGASSARSRSRAASSTARRATGDDTLDRRRPRPGRLLGPGSRLLPERHLLRRQEPARRRRRRSGPGRATTTAPTASTSCSSRRSSGGGAFTVEAEWAKYRQARRLQRATTAPTTAATCWASFLFPAHGRARPVRGARQVRARRTSANGLNARRPRLRPEDDASSTSTTSSSSSTRA